MKRMGLQGNGDLFPPVGSHFSTDFSHHADIIAQALSSYCIFIISG